MDARLIFFLAALLMGCAPTSDYSWQDTREPPREDFGADLETCRSYAARQYQPGMPAGEPYLSEAERSARDLDEQLTGTWRPDRSPFPTMNLNHLPQHDIPVAYTGYPGELDYHPDYLDQILEKCMLDRGWRYLPGEGNRE